jgi:hypothetical protein
MPCFAAAAAGCRGEVKDAVVMDKKGYGFVTFADPKAAMQFLEVRLHVQQQHGRQHQL